MKFKRLISFLLVLVMMLSLTPLSFGADETGGNNSDVGGGGSSGTLDGTWSGSFQFSQYDVHGFRFSLFFAEGATAESLEKGTAVFEPVGKTIDVLMHGQSNVAYSTNMSVFNYMQSPDVNNILNFGFQGANLVSKDAIPELNKTPMSDIMDFSFNGQLSFAKSYTKEDMNMYFMGVANYDKNNPAGDDKLDFTNTTAIANYIISTDSTVSPLGENDFRDGLLIRNGKPVKGIFKLFYEPFVSYQMNGTVRAFTYRDTISYFLVYGDSLYDQQARTVAVWASRIFLAEDEKYINMLGNSSGFQFSPTKSSLVDNAYKNTPGYDSMGVGVVTGGIKNSKDPPSLVKTYVYIDSVDGSGKISYKKAAETTIKELSEVSDFLMDGDGNVSLTPDFDNVEYLEDSGSRAYLNDIVAVDEDLVISSNSEWVNSLLPVNVEVDLKADSSDVAGYLTGIITNSDLYQNNVVKSGTASLNSFSDYYTEVSTNGTKID